MPWWAEVLAFLGGAVTIWVAGTPLSNYTDILADRLHLGRALGRPRLRPAKQHARLGIDSIAVLTLYIVGLIVLPQ